MLRKEAFFGKIDITLGHAMEKATMMPQKCPHQSGL